jgi:hypothetical protein
MYNGIEDILKICPCVQIPLYEHSFSVIQFLAYALYRLRTPDTWQSHTVRISLDLYEDSSSNSSIFRPASNGLRPLNPGIYFWILTLWRTEGQMYQHGLQLCLEVTCKNNFKFLFF